MLLLTIIIGYIGLEFGRKAKSKAFLKFIKAIDCSHIRIKCPVKKHIEYTNHKKFDSIQLQAFSDSDANFTDVFTGFSG